MQHCHFLLGMAGCAPTLSGRVDALLVYVKTDRRSIPAFYGLENPAKESMERQTRPFEEDPAE